MQRPWLCSEEAGEEGTDIKNDLHIERLFIDNIELRIFHCNL